MEILALRILCLIALFVGTFIFGTLPLLVLRKMQNGIQSNMTYHNSKSISFLICFGGGVLFATCFIHLIPEVRINFEDYWNDKANETGTTTKTGKHTHGSIVPELVICGGFMLVYALEEFIHFIINVLSEYHRIPYATSSSESKIVKESTESHEDNSPQLGASGTRGRSYGSISNESHPQENERSLEHEHYSFHGVLIVAALSFHSVFEGLSLGVQMTLHETITLLIAIMIHKFVIAFVAGLEVLTDGGSKKTLFSAIFVFSIMAPLGIMISILTDLTIKGSSHLVSGILNGLATGTLLYVTFLEVLQKEKYVMLSGFLQFTAILLGFCFNSFVQIFA